METKLVCWNVIQDHRIYWDIWWLHSICKSKYDRLTSIYHNYLIESYLCIFYDPSSSKIEVSQYSWYTHFLLRVHFVDLYCCEENNPILACSSSFPCENNNRNNFLQVLYQYGRSYFLYHEINRNFIQ